MEKEKIELGRIRIEMPIPYLSVLDMEIDEEKNQHGKLTLRLMIDGEMDNASILGIKDAGIKVKTPDGTCIFSGIIQGVKAEMEGAYKELTIGALSHSSKLDITKNSRTLQDASKTLSSVAKQVLKGAKVVVKDDAAIPHIVYQNNETDWHFIVRIANQYGIPVFTDSRQDGAVVSLGAIGFASKELDDSAYQKAEVKNIMELRMVQANVDRGAAACNYGGNEMISNDLTIATGDLVSGDVVSKNTIYVEKELMENSIYLYKPEGVKSSCEEMTGTAFVSSVITGTVLAVKDNDIQVQFDVDAEALGSELWIPYESAINNSFYCMPDVGDKVFVYYENNGKIACLGSKHVNTSLPDFATPDEKVFTANDKMIRHTKTGLTLTSTRKKHDDQSEKEISILMEDSTGITICAGKPITVQANENITLSAMEKPLDSVDTQAAAMKFKTASDAGRAEYKAMGGLSPIELLEKTALQEIKNKGQAVIDNLKETAQGMIFYDLWGKSGDSGNQEEAQAAPEPFETGTVTINGIKVVQLEVGDSMIRLSSSGVFFMAKEYEWLGFTKGSHPQQSKENKDWFDTLLDGIQLALDVAGMFPVFGAIPDLINAGISLARGDFAGAAMSALAAIPGVGDAVGACKIVAKGAKLLTKFEKVIKVAKLIYAGANLVATYIRNKDDIIKLYKVIRDGKFDITNPKDWDLVITALSTVQATADTCKDFHDAAKDSKKKKNGDTDSDADSKKKNEGPSDEDKARMKKLEEDARQLDAEKRVEEMTKKRKEREAAEAEAKKPKDAADEKKPKEKPDEKKTNTDQNKECTRPGEPVDIVTGSFVAENIDMILQDITGEFEIKRTYQSVYENDHRMIGKNWFFNIETRINQKDGVYAVQLPDGHKEEFYQTELGFDSKRRGDKTYQLFETETGYLLKDNTEKKQYTYNQRGLIREILDQNQNRLTFAYEKEYLICMTLANGQEIHFAYRNGRLQTITDILGRQVRYDYKDGELYTVTYSNGGVIRYEYNKEGYIRSITDQNDNNFITNYYDKKGRTVRQIASNGEEYIYLYNDREHINSYIESSSGLEIQYEYDKNGRVFKQTYKDGTYEEVDFDSSNNVIYERDRKGNVTLHKYDDRSNLLEEVLSNGFKTTYEYDESDNLIHKTDNNGLEEWYTYDSRGNMLTEKHRITKDSFAETTYEYDTLGRMLSMTDPNGAVTRYQYGSSFAKPTAYITPEGATFYYTYDQAGRLMSIKDEFGEISYGYNSMNYRTLIEDNEGNTTKYVYDKLNNLIKIIYPNQYDKFTGEGAGITYEYDEMDTFYRMTDALGNVTSTPVNCSGKVIKEINPNTYDSATQDGAGISHEYDFDCLRVKTIFPDGGVQRMKYDVKGNMVKQIHPMEYQKDTDDGAGYEYEYDSMDRLVMVRNPYGVVEHYYEYDLAGNIIKEVNAKGYLENGMLERYTGTEHVGTLYHYTFTGWMTEQREPVKIEDGKVWYKLTRYEYDKAGNRTAELRYLDYQTETSVTGRELRIQYQYDKNNRLVQVTDSLGACLQYRYNSNNKVVYERRKINDDTAMIFNYEYNSIGRLVHMYQLGDKNDFGNVFADTYYDYDKSGNLIRVKTPAGHEIRREYDAANRLVMEWHKGADGEIDNRMEYTYDKAGNLVKVTDANGQNMLTSYDLMNRETVRTLKNGGQWLTKYDLNGRVANRISPNEHAKLGEQAKGWQYQYDLLGNVTAVIDAKGITASRITYNKAGEVISELDAMGSGIHNHYDFGGRKLLVETSGNSTQEYEYDAAGNIIGVVDGNRNKTIYRTDEWGRVTQIQSPEDVSELYEYDVAGNIVRATDGNGNATAYHFNVWNKVDVVTDQAGMEDRYAYDMEGNLAFHRDRNGNEIQYTYNMYGSPLRKWSVDGNISQSYGYYKDGTLRNAISDGMRYEYTYYGDGNLKEKRASGRMLLSFEYDLNGNRTKQTDLTGKSTEYRYDILDQLEEIYDNGTRIASYEYYPNGMQKAVHAGTDLHTEFAYDSDLNIRTLKTTLGGECIVDNTYAYDGNGNRIQKNGLWGEMAYQYDSRNQLVKAAYPTYSEELFYDKAGNRTKRLSNNMEERYEYDERNRLVRQSFVNPVAQTVQKVNEFTYDAQGNLLKDEKAVYTYDAFNRAVKAQTSDGKVQVNRYDAENLRYEVEENGKLVQFLFRDRDIVCETADDVVKRYVRDESVLLASDSESARTYYHYASDELGSITHVTDGEKEVFNWYRYDAFGNVTDQKEQVENRFLFCGQQYDGVTGQYYLRARYYNPVIARFTQEDTYRGDGLNLYAYCHNNPVGYWDPSGNMTKAECRKQQANGNQDIRGYRHLNDPSVLGVYQADPRLVVEMPYNGKGKSNSNSQGWLRDNSYYWNEVLQRHPDAFSERNRNIIMGNDPFTTAPINDKTFREYFPQYDVKGLKGKPLIHHHIGGGGQAYGIPSPLHIGSGGVHNVEKYYGIWGTDSQSAGILQTFLD